MTDQCGQSPGLMTEAAYVVRVRIHYTLICFSNDDIQRLTNQLHEKSAMCRSLELQSSHLKLQVQALLGRESHLKAEKEQLMHDNAVKGQDLLLLEVYYCLIYRIDGN